MALAARVAAGGDDQAGTAQRPHLLYRDSYSGDIRVAPQSLRSELAPLIEQVQRAQAPKPQQQVQKPADTNARQGSDQQQQGMTTRVPVAQSLKQQLPPMVALSLADSTGRSGQHPSPPAVTPSVKVGGPGQAGPAWLLEQLLDGLTAAVGRTSSLHNWGHPATCARARAGCQPASLLRSPGWQASG